jgi:hypothetical protein
MRRSALLLAAAGALVAMVLAPGLAAAGGAANSCVKVAGVPILAKDISCSDHRLERESVVLGGVVYDAPNGEGWGSMEPGTIFNGGDPSGLISEVHWSSWGGAFALGRGRNSIFKPHGGYYRRQVVIQVKATRIGRCEGHPAYLRLLVREPRKPGGPVGPWVSWSGPKTLCQPD